MRKHIIIWVIVALLILLFAAPVAAQSLYHKVTMHFEGEYTVETNFLFIDQIVTEFSVAGNGVGMIDSLLKYNMSDISNDWFELF